MTFWLKGVQLVQHLVRVPAKSSHLVWRGDAEQVVAQGDHESNVHVQTGAYIFYLHLISTDEQTSFSDNYFDLIPGEKHTILVTNEYILLTAGMISIRRRYWEKRRLR